jgi:hypothetical protein
VSNVLNKVLTREPFNDEEKYLVSLERPFLHSQPQSESFHCEYEEESNQSSFAPSVSQALLSSDEGGPVRRPVTKTAFVMSSARSEVSFNDDS